MSDERLRKMYVKADELLSKATDELYKPEEDVVTYSACLSARSALYHFLGCMYLLDSDEEVDESLEEGKISIDELLSCAQKSHSEIGEIDFDPMRCTHKDVKDVINGDEIYFCNNVDTVQRCTDLAIQVKDLLINDAFNGVLPGIQPSKGEL